MTGPVDDIDREASLDEPGCPTWATIERHEPVSTLTATTMDENKRVRSRDRLRRFPLHKGRSRLESSVTSLHDVAGDPEVPAAGACSLRIRFVWWTSPR